MTPTDMVFVRLLVGFLLVSACLLLIFPSYAGQIAAQAVKAYSIEMAKP